MCSRPISNINHIIKHDFPCHTDEAILYTVHFLNIIASLDRLEHFKNDLCACSETLVELMTV